MAVAGAIRMQALPEVAYRPGALQQAILNLKRLDQWSRCCGPNHDELIAPEETAAYQVDSSHAAFQGQTLSCREGDSARVA